jgi:hypothetical protein
MYEVFGRTNMTDRKKKHRERNKAGFCHAAGWIAKKDKPAFDKMVDAAADGVKNIPVDSSEVGK